MGLLEIASNNSFWRGYEYYKEGKVLSCSHIEKGQYSGTVKGSDTNTYEVTIDIAHPKRSVCSCPHAEGTRRICKHKVALYCSLYPADAEKIVKAVEEYEQLEEQRRMERSKEIKKYVYSLSKQQLRDELLWRLIDEDERKHY